MLSNSPEGSYLTAGTALLSAGAIALSPINPASTALHELHVPALESGLAVELAAAPNPIQTWVDVVLNAVANVSAVGQGLWALPAPLAQQVVANLINYAAIDIGAYQAAAAGAVTYFGGTGTSSFQSQMERVIAQLAADDIDGAMNTLFGLSGPIISTAQQVFLQMQTALNIPQLLAANLSKTINFVLGYNQSAPPGLIAQLGAVVLTGTLQPLGYALGTDLQGMYSSATAGDWLGLIASVIDVPGQITNSILNGGSALDFTSGLLGSSTNLLGPGLLGSLAVYLPQTLASVIVTPGAQNITAGGTIASAVQNFVAQIATGWPTPSEWASIPTGVEAGLNGLPQAIAGVIATAMHGLFGGTIPGASAAANAAAVASAAAASLPAPAAQTLGLSVPTSLTALSATPADSETTTTKPARSRTAGAGGAHLRAHRFIASSRGDAQVSTSSAATDGSATTGTTDSSGTTSGTGAGAAASSALGRSAPRHHSSSAAAHHAHSGRSK